MQGMNSESVDLIYLNPPFNSNRDNEERRETRSREEQPHVRLITFYYAKVARSRASWSAGPQSVPRRTRMIVSKLFYRIESVHAEEQRLREGSITAITLHI